MALNKVNPSVTHENHYSGESSSCSPSLVGSSLHLFPRNAATGAQYLPENLLANTDIIATYKHFEAEPLSTTFRPYIKHLPGDFHISKKGNVSQQGSLKRVVLGVDHTTLPTQPPQQPIPFHALNFLQLESAFTLQDGGYVKKKHKKRKSNEGDVGDQKKKRKKEGSSGEPKKKRKKKDNAANVVSAVQPLPAL